MATPDLPELESVTFVGIDTVLVVVVVLILSAKLAGE
jgi:hypothetical protein